MIQLFPHGIPGHPLVELESRFAWAATAINDDWHQKIRSAHARRRVFHRGFGQYAALPETPARRINLAGPSPKRILVAGDNDFLSLGLHAAGHDVTVLEIDPLVTDIIRERAPELDVIDHDLRQPLPADLRHSFDVFFADPLSGVGALQLFIARGLQALVPGGTGFVCVSEPGFASFEALRRRLNYDLVAHYSDFNHYYTPSLSLASYVSDMLTLKASADTVMSPEEDELFLARNLAHEDQFVGTPAIRYVFQNIEPKNATHVRLETALKVVERTGVLKIHSKARREESGIRSLVLTANESIAVHIRIDVEQRVAELFVAPSEQRLEEALVYCLFGLFGMGATVVQKRRLRHASLLRMLKASV